MVKCVYKERKMYMATSSFTSSVTVNRKSADSLSQILRKSSKPNTEGVKKVEPLEKEDIKNFKFK